ncbi:MAG: aminopeptidase P N-terminal domain-containing protein [Luteolibacter sp.]
MRTQSAPAEFFTRNRENLRAMLKPRSLLIAHSNDVMPTNADGVMPFRQNTDLYHLTGIHQEETILLIATGLPADPDHTEILFVRETNEEIAVWEGHKLDKQAATATSGIQRVSWTRDFEGHFHRVAPQCDHIYLLTNEHLRAAAIVETRNDRFIRECRERYPLHTYERLAPLMQRLRMIKSDEEIAMLQKACDITGAGFRRVLGFVKPGVGEWEIEAEFLHEFVRSGSRGFAYLPIIGSGKNACVLHYNENNQVCNDGEMLLMDVAAEYAGWNADLTRTIPVNGRFTPRQRDVYNAVLRVLRATNELLRPGNTPAKLQKQVVALMEQELIGLGLIDANEAKKQGPEKPLVKRYFMHGISHHLGLDVHDVAPPNEPFAPGMVFTIEPGIYIREEGLGVRLENDFLIGKNANTDLMAAIPIEVEDIESLMNA